MDSRNAESRPDRPAERSPAPPDASHEAPPGVDPGSDADGEEGRRPTPVRTVMEGGGGEGEEAELELRKFRDPASGEEWIVWISGRSISGILPLRTIPLMELAFAKAEDPRQPLRRATSQGSVLEPLLDDDLVELLHASISYRMPGEVSSNNERRARKGRDPKKPQA